MQCQNHVKQLGIAAHSYHANHNTFPTGTVVESADAVEDRLSLFVLLLPYLEQENLAKQIDGCQGWNSGTNAAVTSMPIRTLVCADSQGSGAVTDFVGVAGVGADAATLSETHVRRGVFGYERATDLKEITDGTSTTLLFIETQRDLGPWASGGPATVRGIDPEEELLIGQGGAFGKLRAMSRWNFGRIKASAVVAMADGSVRRIQEGVSSEVLAALATTAGDDTVPANW
jgi:hypothetical protein